MGVTGNSYIDTMEAGGRDTGYLSSHSTKRLTPVVVMTVGTVHPFPYSRKDLAAILDAWIGVILLDNFMAGITFFFNSVNPVKTYGLN